MLPLRIRWYHVIIIVVVAAEMQLKTLSDCVGCQNDAQPQPELNEFLKTQKKAHRLEYIKQQLINNLHVENRPKEPPKFDSLPEFLVHELVHASETTSSKLNSGAVPDGNEDQTSKQMLLFAEQGKSTNTRIYTYMNALFYLYLFVTLSYIFLRVTGIELIAVHIGF